MGFSATYDVAVVGGGPGGYTAAIRAAQRGLRTVCIDDGKQLGGVGVNSGCIPSKALLNYSLKLVEAQNMLQGMGIETGPVVANFAKMQKAKVNAVKECTDEIHAKFKELGIDHKQGWGKFVSPHSIKVQLKKGGENLVKANNFIIATGSDANSLPPRQNLPLDEKYVCSSSGALEQRAIPKKLMIYGGGIVGIEIGSVYQRLGSQVTVVQRSERICQFLDPEIGEQYVRMLKEQGIKFMVNTEIAKGDNQEEKGVFLHCRGTTGDLWEETIETDVFLVSIGRHAKTAGMGLDQAGITVNKRGQIETTSTWQTTEQPHMYAIGDCATGTMLVHKAEGEALAAVEHIVNGGGSVNYDCIPGVIYTTPEVAWVGKSEEELIAQGIKYNKGVVPINKNFRASICHAGEGLIKVLSCPDTHKFLGIHILSNNAGEMIPEGAAAFHHGYTVQSIGEVSHAHPTLSEQFREACMQAYDKGIHY